MPFPRVTERAAVLSAIAEYDEFGAEAFWERHGYGRARKYLLEHAGGFYDSKAILGVAHSYQHPGERILNTDFSGGVPVALVLEGLGFTVARVVPTAGDAVVRVVPLERNVVHETERAPAVGTERAIRKEAELVDSFVAHLVKLGHESVRHRIRVVDGNGHLATDLFDATAEIVYEAKSQSDRATVRLGLGQLLDYRRFLTPGYGYRLLLPEKPLDELVGLLSLYDIGVTWPDGGGWCDLAPHDFHEVQADATDPEFGRHELPAASARSDTLSAPG